MLNDLKAKRKSEIPRELRDALLWGDLKKVTSDIGAMELYASSVISSDPFEVARVLRKALLHPVA